MDWTHPVGKITRILERRREGARNRAPGVSRLGDAGQRRKDGQQRAQGGGDQELELFGKNRAAGHKSGHVVCMHRCGITGALGLHADSSMPFTGAQCKVGGTHSGTTCKAECQGLILSDEWQKPWFPLKKQFKGPFCNITHPFPAGAEAKSLEPFEDWLSLLPGGPIPRGGRSAVTVLLLSLLTHVTLWNSYTKLHLTRL